jgi:tRNA modification GTPase
MDHSIAAIATPPGEGGVAIVRISGKEAIAIASKIFSKDITNLASHKALFGKFLDGNEAIDSGLILLMRAPNSFTGEDVVECHCHGSTFIARRLLTAILKAGATLAGPGEFTKRAFLNGKLDLPQAEAVQSLISAKNELSLAAAEQQLEGKLSKKILEFQKELTDLAAILEAWIDFPEEGLEFATMEEILEMLREVLLEMVHLQNTYHHGRILHHGICLCLAGQPNAGKSSLMNALLGKDRAIVTSTPGTTRDVLVEDLRLGNLHFHLMDTAGLRDTEEFIEMEGIRRTKKSMQEADLILYVLDATKGLEIQDQEILTGPFKEKILPVWNKCDLPNLAGRGVKISALHNEGMDGLIQAIESMICKDGIPDKEEIILTHARHYDALVKAILFLQRLLEGLEKRVSPEFLSADMRCALESLSAIIGTDITEEILSAIFSKFCVGK